MGKLSIKVVVAGRTYPLTVKEGEEAIVLKAAEEINHGIKLLQENYAVKDMQDLLAMTSLQLVTKNKSVSPNNGEELSEIEEKLKAIADRIQDFG